jgi:uncharacterized protein YegP (UPF0339 family)
MAAGYFLLTKSGNQFKFALKAGNHETILSSELYAAKSSAVNGIASVKTNSSKDASYERKTSKDDKPYFVSVRRTRLEFDWGCVKDRVHLRL